MGRMNKEEQARQDGMDYAYRLAKKEGMEALEARITRNRKTIAPAFVNDSMLKDFEHYVKNNCIISFTCIMAMILRDKYGFGRKRMSEFAAYFYDMADSISEKWLTYKDIIETIREETGVDLTSVEVMARSILSETERTLDKKR